jgi:chemotaxis protein MotB
MHRTVIIASLLTALASTGCITKKQHQAALDDAQAKLDAVNATLEDDRRKLSEVLEEAERQSLESRRQIETLEAQLADLQQQLESTEAQRAELEGSLASSLKDKVKLKASVAGLTAALAAQNARNILAERRVKEFKRMLERFKPLIDAGRLDVRIVDGRMVLQMPSDVLFSTGSARLSDDGQATVAEIGRILSLMPDREFQVEGHTDNVPIRTKRFRNNWELASARALTVVDVLMETGVAPKQVSAAAYADTQPRASNDTEEGRSKNRRIEIAVIPDLSDLPGFDELQKLSK